MHVLYLVDCDKRPGPVRIVAISTDTEKLKEAAAKDCDAAARGLSLEWEAGVDESGEIVQVADFCETYEYKISPAFEVL